MHAETANKSRHAGECASVTGLRANHKHSIAHSVSRETVTSIIKAAKKL